MQTGRRPPTEHPGDPRRNHLPTTSARNLPPQVRIYLHVLRYTKPRRREQDATGTAGGLRGGRQQANAAQSEPGHQEKKGHGGLQRLKKGGAPYADLTPKAIASLYCNANGRLISERPSHLLSDGQVPEMFPEIVTL